MPDDKSDICPYPGHDSVVCPECRAEIPGVVPSGSSENPQARCPECENVITTIIVRK